jgi:hypothetical protein
MVRVQPPGRQPKENRLLEFYDDRSYDPTTRKIVQQGTVFGVNGYATFHFANQELEIDYCDIADEKLVIEHWSVRQGNVVRLQVPDYCPSVTVDKGGRIVVSSITAGSD